MRVMIIDPWCENGSNLESYTIGLCEGLGEQVELLLCCGYYEPYKSDKFDIRRVFFKLSDKMREGKIRKLVRGIEYCLAYLKIIRMVKRENIEIVHIEWALKYRLDIIFISILKKHVNKIVYTAHNVIPHINGERYIESLRVLYGLTDTILVHGESIKREFAKYFPEIVSKVAIQRHGIYLTQKVDYNENNVDERIIEFVRNASGTICSCLGLIFYNKGTDRIIRYWINNEAEENCLIVAGKYEKVFIELDELIPNISKYPNILFIPRFLNEDEFAYILSHSNIVSVPYRHASMSGIVYSAAAFSKAVAYTNTGALKEYFCEDCGFIVSNNDDEFEVDMKTVMSNNKEKLFAVGENFHRYIYTNYNWEGIAKMLVDSVYTK